MSTEPKADAAAPEAPQAPAAPEAPEQPPFPAVEVDDLRAQNKALAKKLADYEKAAEAKKEADLAEAGKYQELADKRSQELLEAQAKYTSLLRANALQAAGIKAGLADLAYLRMIDADALEINDEGNVVGADEALATLKENHPALFQVDGPGKPNAVPTPRSAGVGGTKAPDPTRAYSSEEIKNMTDEQFLAWQKAKKGQHGQPLI